MLESRVGSEFEARFLDSVASRELELAELAELADTDTARMAELVRRYDDFPLGAVDASVVVMAERHGTTRLATLDHRHFHGRPGTRGRV